METVSKYYFIVLFLIISAGCGQKKWTPVHRIETQFVTYVTQFEASCGVSIEPIVIEFGPAGLWNIGSCETFGEQKVIWIDEDMWKKTNERQKIVTIFHELGHCVLDKPHTEPDALSIMTPSFFDEPKDYEEHWEFLVEDLCTQD